MVFLMCGVEVYQPTWRGNSVGFRGVISPHGRAPIFLAPFGKLLVLGGVESFEVSLSFREGLARFSRFWACTGVFEHFPRYRRSIITNPTEGVVFIG